MATNGSTAHGPGNTGPRHANVLVFPGMDAANAAIHTLSAFGNAQPSCGGAAHIVTPVSPPSGVRERSEQSTLKSRQGPQGTSVCGFPELPQELFGYRLDRDSWHRECHKSLCVDPVRHRGCELGASDYTGRVDVLSMEADIVKPQWVCRVCGYNMIGTRPDVCPFCGEPHDVFLAWHEAEATYRVTATRVSDQVTQLMSVPRLGIEHAAYRLETASGPIWIDSPSALNRDLPPVEHIFFTHPDFMGACNQYRQIWSAQVHLHRLDAANPLVEQFPVDDPFDGDFVHGDLEAFHIGGHTPGFTVYVFGRVLFVCDYVFPPDETMHFNPYSPGPDDMREGGERIRTVTEGRDIEAVCGYNYVAEFDDWMPRFESLLAA